MWRAKLCADGRWRDVELLLEGWNDGVRLTRIQSSAARPATDVVLTRAPSPNVGASPVDLTLTSTSPRSGDEAAGLMQRIARGRAARTSVELMTTRCWTAAEFDGCTGEVASASVLWSPLESAHQESAGVSRVTIGLPRLDQSGRRSEWATEVTGPLLRRPLLRQNECDGTITVLVEGMAGTFLFDSSTGAGMIRIIEVTQTDRATFGARRPTHRPGMYWSDREHADDTMEDTDWWVRLEWGDVLDGGRARFL